MRQSIGTVIYDHQIFAYQRFGGVSRYFIELASRIPTLSSFSTRIVAPLHVNEYLRNSPTPKFASLRPLSFRGGMRVRGAVNRVASRLIMEALRPAVVHWTYFNPVRLPGKSLAVVTVYDMIHELFADQFSADDPTSANKRRSVQRADHVICISQNTKTDLMRLFGVPDNKISITHMGFSSAFRLSNPASSPVEPVTTRPYLLYVGQRGGYKAFADAVRAYASSSRLSEAFDFLAFGGPNFHPAEHALFDSLKLREGSVRRAIGNDDDLAKAYRNAQAFVYPSRYEGFGIPPLEAMGCGCPVVCANTSSLPEVVGDAAILFDPWDRDSLREALESVCFDGQRRAALIEAGIARSSRFSWDRCARETAALYTRLIAA